MRSGSRARAHAPPRRPALALAALLEVAVDPRRQELPGELRISSGLPVIDTCQSPAWQVSRHIAQREHPARSDHRLAHALPAQHGREAREKWARTAPCRGRARPATRGAMALASDKCLIPAESMAERGMWWFGWAPGSS